jgi:hypothetical protein
MTMTVSPRTALIFLGAIALAGWLSVTNLNLSPSRINTKSVGLGKYGFSVSKGWIEVISLADLKEQSAFDAEVLMKTNGWCQPWTTNFMAQGRQQSSAVPYAMITLRTSAGQTFAVREENPSPTLIGSMQYLEIGKRYNFPGFIQRYERIHKAISATSRLLGLPPMLANPTNGNVPGKQ